MIPGVSEHGREILTLRDGRALDVRPYDLDDDLVHAVARDAVTRASIYRPDHPMVVLGRGSRIDVEVDVGACATDGADMRRRRAGGCAVVLDPGNVVVSVATAAPGIGGSRQWFPRLTGWIVEGLTTVGIPGVRVDGVSDLVMGSRKVGGSAIWRTRGLVYFSTTILAMPRLDLQERWLAHPPREPAYRRGRSHRDFVGDVSGFLDPADPAADLEARLDDALDPGRLPGNAGTDLSRLPGRTP